MKARRIPNQRETNAISVSDRIVVDVSPIDKMTGRPRPRRSTEPSRQLEKPVRTKLRSGKNGLRLPAIADATRRVSLEKMTSSPRKPRRIDETGPRHGTRRRKMPKQNLTPTSLKVSPKASDRATSRPKR